MSGTDIVFFYTDPYTGEDYYGVRDLFNAWVAAGRPPINSAGRLYWVQKAARDAYLNGTGSPADDPDQPGRYELAHVRHAALDIDATPERVRALSAAGLVRPFSYEPWHWRLQSIYNYPIVNSIPVSAAGGAVDFPTPELKKKRKPMSVVIERKDFDTKLTYFFEPGFVKHLNGPKEIQTMLWLTGQDEPHHFDESDFQRAIWGFGLEEFDLNSLESIAAKPGGYLVAGWNNSRSADPKA